ncbi:MAG TPA: heterodisulfide reductase-related iron-sulfur binding cluster [Vicinamibacteria bacterium]|nr:heterodisulfide reductase-related iron-sulfur binding cluster [Vicinamibacteria bacterium]
MASTTAKPISYKPTDGLSYDPEDPRYWEEAALAGEVTRAFELCHGCRMCFKYCDSFPILFDLVDRKHDGDVTRITAGETDRVMDACFQCKLCEVQCPYTPREKHEFQLDLPKLVHRYKAVRTRARGVPLRERILADPDRASAMARASLGLANLMNRVGLHRLLMQAALGIHKDKLLPDFASTTFEKWAERSGRIRQGAEGVEAVLFPTCYVQNNEPQIGRDTLEVLERNQVVTACVKGLQCCGMPAWESGDLQALRRQAANNLEVLAPFLAAGAKVVALNPTCAMMMRREYPDLLPGPLRPAARRLAELVRDPSELLWEIRDQPRFNTDFRSTPGGPVAYHAPCHLRAQGIGFKGRDLLRRIPGVVPKMTMECCGHDGTHAMKVEGFLTSIRVGQKAFEGMKSADAEVWATDCPLAALQFQQHAGKKPLHPMSILARAYRADGFPNRVGPGPDQSKEDAGR